ncbi:MAG: flagellar assembly protein FliX [Alphaproteobacteria bacterium]|nr:flagellar assembly protein FliX [Alphaproteobacteria bacterium]
MFRIDNIKKSSETVKTKSAKSVSSGESFANYLKNSAISDETKVNTASAMTNAGAIFATQMVDDEEERQIRKKLVKKANILLDNLEEIRQEIIFGSVSKEKLIEISRLVKQKDVETNDEKLKDILEEIELRVEVELAKLFK